MQQPLTACQCFFDNSSRANTSVTAADYACRTLDNLPCSGTLSWLLLPATHNNVLSLLLLLLPPLFRPHF
jgi:hypothetical protein